MRISLEMPDAVYGRLVAAADTKGVKVADLLGDAVAVLIGEATISHHRASTGSKLITPEILEKVIAAHEGGMTWSAIADEFKMPVSTLYGAMRRQTGRRSR